MDYLENLKKRYEEKKQNHEFNEEEVQFLGTFLNDDFCFLRVKSNEAVGIIRSLGIPDEETFDYYEKIFISMLKEMKNRGNEQSEIDRNI